MKNGRWIFTESNSIKNEKLGLFLKKQRQKKGITQEKVATYLNKSIITIKRYEKGVTPINNITLVSLMLFLEITPQMLVEVVEENNINQDFYNSVISIYSSTKELETYDYFLKFLEMLGYKIDSLSFKVKTDVKFEVYPGIFTNEAYREIDKIEFQGKTFFIEDGVLTKIHDDVMKIITETFNKNKKENLKKITSTWSDLIDEENK